MDFAEPAVMVTEGIRSPARPDREPSHDVPGHNMRHWQTNSLLTLVSFQNTPD